MEVFSEEVTETRHNNWLTSLIHFLKNQEVFLVVVLLILTER